MSKQANKTVIGIFVVGAIALAIVAVLILGSGKFFKETFKAVCYFDGSVGGLNIGAPVVFRGVKIGSVTGVVLLGQRDKLIFVIPVYIEIEPDKIQVVGTTLEEPGKNLMALIQRGLRATLEMQSIVTGQMQVGLDMYPDKPAKFAENKIDTKTPEIPTISTPMQELAKKIQKLPIDEIFDKISSTLDAINKVAQSPEIPEAIRSVNLTLGDVRRLVRNVDGQVGPLASNLNETVQDVRKLVQNVDVKVTGVTASLDETVKDVRGLVQNADAKVTGLASNLDETIKDVRVLVQNADTKVTGLASNLDETIKEGRGVLRNVNNGIEPLLAGIEKSIQSLNTTMAATQKLIDGIDSRAADTSYELNKTLEEIRGLARSVRILSEHLERHPESILWGK
jgi:paraquat-inducible protein B